MLSAPLVVVVVVVGVLSLAVPPLALVADPERLLAVVEVVAVVVAPPCVSLPELSTIQPGTRAAAQSSREIRRWCRGMGLTRGDMVK